MEAHWLEATVGEDGRLVLENLPFGSGQSVEVLIVSRSTPEGADKRNPLLGSVLEYRDPFEPVADEEWDALR
jgi:hypothetical protein